MKDQNGKNVKEEIEELSNTLIIMQNYNASFKELISHPPTEPEKYDFVNSKIKPLAMEAVKLNKEFVRLKMRFDFSSNEEANKALNDVSNVAGAIKFTRTELYTVRAFRWIVRGVTGADRQQKFKIKMNPFSAGEITAYGAIQGKALVIEHTFETLTDGIKCLNLLAQSLPATRDTQLNYSIHLKPELKNDADFKDALVSTSSDLLDVFRLTIDEFNQLGTEVDRHIGDGDDSFGEIELPSNPEFNLPTLDVDYFASSAASPKAQSTLHEVAQSGDEEQNQKTSSQTQVSPSSRSETHSDNELTLDDNKQDTVATPKTIPSPPPAPPMPAKNNSDAQQKVAPPSINSALKTDIAASAEARRRRAGVESGLGTNATNQITSNASNNNEGDTETIVRKALEKRRQRFSVSDSEDDVGTDNTINTQNKVSTPTAVPVVDRTAVVPPAPPKAPPMPPKAPSGSVAPPPPPAPPATDYVIPEAYKAPPKGQLSDLSALIAASRAGLVKRAPIATETQRSSGDPVISSMARLIEQSKSKARDSASKSASSGSEWSDEDTNKKGPKKH